MPYYMALTLSRLPLQVILNIIFLSLVYWMSGLPNQLWRFALFALIGVVVSFVAEGMGLAIGATFSVTVSINTLCRRSIKGNQLNLNVMVNHNRLIAFIDP